MHCVIERQLNQYLAQQDAEELREGYIQDRIAELMRGVFDPLAPDNLFEALGTCDESAMQNLAYHLNLGDMETAGYYLLQITYGYWRNQAEERAIKELGNHESE